MTDISQPRHPARRSRIAAVGIGVAAMAGLVGNMEVAGSRAHAASATSSPVPPVPGAKADMAYRHKVVQERLAAVRLPIVLTPHTVVHSVAAPAVSSGGSYSGTTYAAAPARAAAPVASTGGSRP